MKSDTLTKNDINKNKEKRTTFAGIVFIVLSSLVITTISLLLGLGLYNIQIFFDYFRHPLIFLLNWFPVILLELFFLGVSGSCWISYLISALIILLSSIGSFYKIRFRGEPFVFSDIRIIRTALGVAKEFDLSPNTRIILAILAIVAGTLFFFLFFRLKMNRTVRAILVAVPAILMLLSWKPIYMNENVYYNKAVSEDHIEVKTMAAIESISKGSVYPFLFSIHEQAEISPDGYSEETVKEILEKNPSEVISESQKTHFLVFQLESFCDLTAMGLDNLLPETYELYHELEEKGISGDLITNTIGGGTVNSERTFLTGYYSLPEYREPAYSHVWYLRGQGYQTVANHPYSRNYYSRSSVNYYLGFEDFWSMDDLYAEVSQQENVWLSDYLLFPTVLEQFRSMIRNQKPVFSFVVTAQGHGGYSTEEYFGETEYWQDMRCSQPVRNQINNYLNIIVDTQHYLSEMLYQLERETEPVVVIIYGDHKPMFSADFYDETGINMDLSSAEGFFNYYATRYLIWANNAAKQKFHNEFSGKGPTMSPCYLMTYTFDQLGWKGSTLMQFNRQIMERIPVINTNGYYMVDGNLCTSLSEEDESLLQKMGFLQYYLQHNNDYAD